MLKQDMQPFLTFILLGMKTCAGKRLSGMSITPAASYSIRISMGTWSNWMWKELGENAINAVNLH